MISETKLDESFPTSQFFMKGFSSPHRLDRNCNGGGILLYIREDIPSKPLSIERDLTEAFFVKINLHNKKKWLISCSYNPKRASIANHLLIRPVETGGGMQPPKILAKVDLLPIDNNSEK